ncbi:MAG TPA: type II toxin-antitoxin system RelE/ParE family toxin [Rudaea sp.]|nr:type II toxin-antitoxin system RelE/ParE family toxin [Rudaea sp.]
MARRLSWSPEAIEDIEAIASYIGRDSRVYARIVAARIVETASEIVRFPLSGRVVPEVGDTDLRERFVYSYRVMYRVLSDRVLVIAVVHGSRLLDTLADAIAERQT